MPLRLAGYVSDPESKAGHSQSGMPANSKLQNWQAVFSDDEGKHFVASPSGDEMGLLPFKPNRRGTLDKASQGTGGFVPIADVPSAPGGSDDSFGEMMSGMMQQLPQQMAIDWVGKAAQNLMLGGGPGGMMDAAMMTLGIQNPLASGPIGAALGSALTAAGLGPMASLLPSLGSMLNGGSMSGLGSALGRAALGNVPGLGGLGGSLGGQLGNLADMMAAGGVGGSLSDLADQISNCMPSIGSDASDILAGPCNGGIAGAGESFFDPSAVSAQAVGQVADYLAGQWKVDDESSAAEHIAHQAVMEHRGTAQQAIQDEILGTQGGGFDGLADRIKGFFTGVPQGTGQPAVRISDVDDAADLSIMGVGTILFEKMQVSRLTDKVAGPKAPPPGKMIILGEPSVLSAGLPTAFVGTLTEVATKMAKGAPTILVGGAVVAALQKASDDAANKSNGPPDAPPPPKKAKSGSEVTPSNGEGSSHPVDTADSSAGDPAAEPDSAPTLPSEPSTDGQADSSMGGPTSTSSSPTTESQDSPDDKYDLARDLNGVKDELKKQIVDPIVSIGEAAGNGAAIWAESPSEGWSSFKSGMGVLYDAAKEKVGAASDRLAEWYDDPEQAKNDIGNAWNSAKASAAETWNDIENEFTENDRPLTGVAKALPYALGAAGTAKIAKEGIEQGAKVLSKGLKPDGTLDGGTDLRRGTPTNIGPYPTKAPPNVSPGTRELEGHHMNDRGRIEPWRAHYDEYGRRIGRTDYNAGNRTAGIPSTHYDKWEYSSRYPDGRQTDNHVPGEFPE